MFVRLYVKNNKVCYACNPVQNSPNIQKLRKLGYKFVGSFHGYDISSGTIPTMTKVLGAASGKQLEFPFMGR